MAGTTSFSETDGSLGGTLSDAASQVKRKVANLRRDAKDAIDGNRDTAATGLEKAAASVHGNAESLPGGERISALAHATADRLTSTAEYVRDHDVDSMMADVDRIVRKNPGAALLTAGILGFLVGRAFTSSDNRS